MFFCDSKSWCFQGVWKPRKIPNPAYFEDLHPFRMTPFSAVGLELWSMTADIFFDNFFISNDRNTAERWANDGWGLKKAAEGAAEVGSGPKGITSNLKKMCVKSALCRAERFICPLIREEGHKTNQT